MHLVGHFYKIYNNDTIYWTQLADLRKILNQIFEKKKTS